MKAVFAGKAQPGAVGAARRLLASGLAIVTVNSPGTHHALKEAGIAHQDQGLLVAGADSTTGVAVVVGGLESAADVAGDDPSTHALIRAAAVQHARIAVVVDPEDLSKVAGESPSATDGLMLSSLGRRSLAAKALRATSAADSRIAESLLADDTEAIPGSGGGSGGAVVLVIGSGGREHAIALKLADSPRVSHVYVSPGNGGTGSGRHAGVSNADIPSSAKSGDGPHAAVVEFAKSKGVSLVAVGPEVPLVDGVADALEAAGVPCFGPSAAAAKLEASKAYSKDFMARNDLRTARYACFTDFEAARSYVMEAGHRVVVKASGLAAGKGVLMPETKEEAVAALEVVMVKKEFGESGAEVVVEEFLEGEEVSILAICDGKTAVCMPGAQDHKRALDGDGGLNTGGMGAYAPAPCLTPRLARECADICQSTVTAMAAEGSPFVGVLFAGFMLTKEGPVVLEFNVRMGDPETQALLPLMESDLYEVMLACTEGRLAETPVAFTPGAAAATVVLAADGYPGKYPKGMPISGLEDAAAIPGVTVYHAGTKAAAPATATAAETQLSVSGGGGGGGVVSSGGRVLAVTGTGASFAEALDAAYRGVGVVKFSPCHYRKDIGHRAKTAPLRVGVLASGRGTALQAVIDSCATAAEDGGLNAEVVIVVTNKKEAPVRDRAKKHGIPEIFVASKGRERAAFDEEVTKALEDAGVQLVLCVGYMRILSPEFCRQWAGRCLNVHPSLLPDFAGGMDLQVVHEAVIAAGKTRSGCTVHQVTEEVDSGPIVVQEEVEVVEGETPESLKAKVQAKEGPAFLKAMGLFMKGGGRGGTLPPPPGAAAAAAAPSSGMSYKDAGVDIDAGNSLVERIKPACKSTRRPGCDSDLGGFGGLFDLAAAGYEGKDTILVGATDGVGTKLKVAQIAGDHSGVGIDLVAMCVNDLIVAGAEPMFFLDYYATGKLSVSEAATVIESIAEGCRQANCGLIGGETAEMPSMYPAGEYDLAGFSVGAVSRGKVLPLQVSPGDVVLGLPSSGVHSNGFSLVRRIVEVKGLSYGDPAPFNAAGGGAGAGGKRKTLAEELLVPTRIYVRALLPLLRAGLAKALAHITGGGLSENIPRVLGADVAVRLRMGSAAAAAAGSSSAWDLPEIFQWLSAAGGLTQEELLRTLNCGVGMVVVVAPEAAEEARRLLREAGEEVVLEMGVVEERAGPDAPQVVYEGRLKGF
ncbi:unnamed protein product [Ectocarpus sp. 6 AP-2014]